MNDGISRNNTPAPTLDDSTLSPLPMLPMLVHQTSGSSNAIVSTSRRRQDINATDDDGPDKKRIKKSWQPSPRKQRFDNLEFISSSSPRDVDNPLVVHNPLPNNDDDDHISLQFLFPQLNLKDGGSQNIYSTPQTRPGNNPSLPLSPANMSSKFPSLSSLRGSSGNNNETPIIALVPRFRPHARSSSTAVQRRVTIDEEKVQVTVEDSITLLPLQGAPMTPPQCHLIDHIYRSSLFTHRPIWRNKF